MNSNEDKWDADVFPVIHLQRLIPDGCRIPADQSATILSVICVFHFNRWRLSYTK